ncbi:DUF5954 family protein [Peterkaempfera bronchialis]|uniref:DUF5954 family protein n=1 Tax=Peterkaempfera bronchialis TaxID=2126346 RepID=UPI003C2E2C6F
MDHDGERVEEHRVIRVAPQDSPVADLMDLEAWEARGDYPELRARGPLFAVGRLRDDGQHGGGQRDDALWEIVLLEEGNPQAARDALLWRLKTQGRETEDPAARAAYLAASKRLEWEALDELTVLGDAYRVIRGDLLVRFGPDGPEPPRPTDPDGQDPRAPHRAEGFVIDPARATGMSEAVLRAELLDFAYSREVVPEDVYADSVRARTTHPGVVLLPAGFAVAERQAGREWEPMSGVCATPQAARDGLSDYLRDLAPRLLDLTGAEQAAYAREADRLGATRDHQAQVAGRHFRVVRVESIVRVGPDGPELPRPSDWVPYPPSAVQDQQLRAEAEAEAEEGEDKDSG